MAKCKKCKKELDPNAKFCKYCGTSVKTNSFFYKNIEDIPIALINTTIKYLPELLILIGVFVAINSLTPYNSFYTTKGPYHQYDFSGVAPGIVILVLGIIIWLKRKNKKK